MLNRMVANNRVIITIDRVFITTTARIHIIYQIHKQCTFDLEVASSRVCQGLEHLVCLRYQGRPTKTNVKLAKFQFYSTWRIISNIAVVIIVYFLIRRGNCKMIF